MIVRSKAPLRLGLAGGGSDVAPYSTTYGGLVLNATINLFAYCSIESLDERKIEINSFDNNFQGVYATSRELPLADNGAILIKGVYNRLMRDYGCTPEPMRITTFSDAPAGSGLGTSSTMVVAIIKAFCEWYSLPLGDYEISRLAYEVERIDLNLSGGKQDQYAAAFGGFNYIEFTPEDNVIVNPLRVNPWTIEELESSLLLYFTGRSRMSAAIIDEQKRNTSQGVNSAIEAMHRIKQSAIDMKTAILTGNISDFAKILGQAWEDKKKMADAITNPVIQKAFDVACAAGAYSGKVSGAGGGGFIMLAINPTHRKSIVAALKELGGFVLPFQFCPQGVRSWRINDDKAVN